MMRSSMAWIVVAGALGGGCADGAEPEAQPAELSAEPLDTVPAADYTDPVVLFVGPDSAEIERLRERLGDDAFYTTADDAMWYNASAYELLDSLHITYRDVERGSASFLVNGAPTEFSWADVDAAWFLVVYDGRTLPVFSAAIDIHAVVDSMRSTGR